MNGALQEETSRRISQPLISHISVLRLYLDLIWVILISVKYCLLFYFS